MSVFPVSSAYRRSSRTLLSIALALGMLACTSEQTATGPSARPDLARQAAGAYTAVDLGTPGWPSLATAISPAGDIVGTNQGAETFQSHATLWEKNGGMTDLGTLGGTRSEGAGISPSGEVVGASVTSDGDFHATLWKPE